MVSDSIGTRPPSGFQPLDHGSHFIADLLGGGINLQREKLLEPVDSILISVLIYTDIPQG